MGEAVGWGRAASTWRRAGRRCARRAAGCLGRPPLARPPPPLSPVAPPLPLEVADIATDRFRPTRARCSAGAEKWLDLQVHQSTEDCIAALRARGFRVAVARAGPGAVPASDVDWTVPTAFIMGNEARGVSEAAQAAADFGVCIPMVGFAESLNVSVAAALLMGAARAQLDAAGAGRLAPAQAEALAAAMLLRHKGQQGRAGQAWQAPLVRGLALRGGG